ncbi:hypothetical protein [Streptomyces sp. NPDC054975]
MSTRAPSYEQCITNARAVLDQARRRIAADYAAGRLSPEHTAQYERLIAQSRRRSAA